MGMALEFVETQFKEAGGGVAPDQSAEVAVGAVGTLEVVGISDTPWDSLGLQSYLRRYDWTLLAPTPVPPSQKVRLEA